MAETAMIVDTPQADDPNEDHMVKISKLIADMSAIQERYGDTCVYIRRGGLSWGAVALNRRDDDKKHGVFDLQAAHDRAMLERIEQIERLIKDRDDWRTRASKAETEFNRVAANLDTATAEIARLTAERDDARAWAEVFEWLGEMPADEVERLKKVQIDEAEIQRLKQERDEARAALEHDRSIAITAVNEFSDAFARRSWLLEGRGPYEWDDDRYRDEFKAAYEELSAPIEKLRKIGRDWSNCPTDHDEIMRARINWETRAEAAEAKIEKLETVVAEAYQIVGSLSEYAGLHDHPDVQRALDHLAYEDKRSDDILPWPREPIPEFEERLAALPALAEAREEIERLKRAVADGGE